VAGYREKSKWILKERKSDEETRPEKNIKRKTVMATKKQKIVLVTGSKGKEAVETGGVCGQGMRNKPGGGGLSFKNSSAPLAPKKGRGRRKRLSKRGRQQAELGGGNHQKKKRYYFPGILCSKKPENPRSQKKKLRRCPIGARNPGGGLLQRDLK